MALVLADRVKETTTTAGTGTVTLLGAAPGFQSFAAVGNANTTYYTIAAQTGTEWEVGIGTYTLSGTTLARTTVLSNSAGTQPSALSFSAGPKDVFVTYPSGKSVNLDASGNATALGTPAAFVGTNITGTASGLTAGNVTTNANLTGDVTSSGNATTLATVNSNVGSFTFSSVTVNAKGLVTAASSGSAPVAFPATTAMMFVQTAAPTGWTKSTTHDNKALRVVTGSASSGGTTAFSTVFTNQTPSITTSGLSAGATTLAENQMPSHAHSIRYGNAIGGYGNGSIVTGADTLFGTGSGAVGSTGGGGSHTHTVTGSATSSAITLAVQYVDVIIATKD
jgi:hypothetical protein